MRGLIAAAGLKFLFAVGLILFVLFVLAFSIHVVPPISAKVVDAVSGKPLGGMNVCLEVMVRDWGKAVDLRLEQTRTDPSGVFSFSPSIHTHVMQSWQGYSIRVTDPRMDFVPRCGPALSGAYFSTFIEGAKLAPMGKDDPPLYFPVAVVNEPSMPTSLGVNVVRRKMGFPVGGHIALIPLLGNVEGCQPIENSDLAGSCRQLNGSAAASTLRNLSQGISTR